MGGKFISGIVVNGLGEGTYFMSMEHYQDEIRKKLGFGAYPGTLNIKVTKKQAALLKKSNPIKINGFKSNGKAFGGADCYRAKIGSIGGSIIIPDVNKHGKDVIEFIAPIHVKSCLKVKNGDKIKVEMAEWQK